MSSVLCRPYAPENMTRVNKGLKTTCWNKVSDKPDQWQTPRDREASIRQGIFILHLPGNPVFSVGRRMLFCRTGPNARQQ